MFFKKVAQLKIRTLRDIKGTRYQRTLALVYFKHLKMWQLVSAFLRIVSRWTQKVEYGILQRE